MKRPRGSFSRTDIRVGLKKKSKRADDKRKDGQHRRRRLRFRTQCPGFEADILASPKNAAEVCEGLGEAAAGAALQFQGHDIKPELRDAGAVGRLLQRIPDVDPDADLFERPLEFDADRRSDLARRDFHGLDHR